MRSLNTSDASVFGQPSTGSSSLMPDGHAAEGLGDVGRRRDRPGPVGVEVGEAVEVARLDGRQGGVELLDRRALAGAEGVDERAGVTGPRACRSCAELGTSEPQNARKGHGRRCSRVPPLRLHVRNGQPSRATARRLAPTRTAPETSRPMPATVSQPVD